MRISFSLLALFFLGMAAVGAEDAPTTPAPITPAPITPAPVTPAPVTPAPITPAPVTPAPTLAPTSSPTAAPTKGRTMMDVKATFDKVILPLNEDAIGFSWHECKVSPEGLRIFQSPTSTEFEISWHSV